MADTRKFTGWEAWWTNLYNESHLYFALLTVVIIPVVGLIFGVLADMIMSRIGIDLNPGNWRNINSKEQHSLGG